MIYFWILKHSSTMQIDMNSDITYYTNDEKNHLSYFEYKKEIIFLIMNYISCFRMFMVEFIVRVVTFIFLNVQLETKTKIIKDLL
jgi:hypothetical protein